MLDFFEFEKETRSWDQKTLPQADFSDTILSAECVRVGIWWMDGKLLLQARAPHAFSLSPSLWMSQP